MVHDSLTLFFHMAVAFKIYDKRRHGYLILERIGYPNTEAGKKLHHKLPNFLSFKNLWLIAEEL